MLDHAVTWRAAVYVLAGHWGGAVVARGPPATMRRTQGRERADGEDLADIVAGLEVSSGEEDGEAAPAQTASPGRITRRHAARVSKYLRLRSTNPPEAEAFLAQCIRPRGGVRVRLQDPATGEPLTTQEALRTLTEEVRERAADRGTPEAPLLREMEDRVREMRRQMMQMAGKTEGDEYPVK